MPKEVKNNTQVNIPEEQLEIQDEFYDQDGYEPEEVPEEHSNKARELTKGINLSNKGMLIALVVVGALILYILFGGKLGLPSLSVPSFGDGEDTEQGAASKLASGDSADPDSLETDDVSYIIADLSEYYPGYDITRDDETQTITAVGEFEGQSHKLVLNYDGEYLEELIGDTALDETGEAVESPEEEGKDSVTVPITEYTKSSLSQPKQVFVEAGEEGDLGAISTEERVIVEFEKLPVTGSNLTIYSKVIETGEVIIFNVTLNQYASLDAKGTTVLHLTRSEGYNVKVIDRVSLVNWQD